MADSESTCHGPPPPGSISWTEIPVQDISRAKKFYADIFGWQCIAPPNASSSTPPSTQDPSAATANADRVMFQKGMTYGAFRKVEAGDHLSAALYDGKGNRKVGVTVTINSEDIDGTLELIEEGGGSIWLPKRQIPGENMGYLAYFLDTEKNVMGIWSMR